MTDQPALPLETKPPEFPTLPGATVSPIPDQPDGEKLPVVFPEIDKPYEPAFTEPEAPVVLYTTFWLPDSSWFNMTLRGSNPVNVLEDFMSLKKYAHDIHSITGVKPDMFNPMPAPMGMPSPQTTTTSMPTGALPPTAPQAFPPQSASQAASAPQPPQQRDSTQGTDTLNSLVIAPDPKTGKLVYNFSVGKFKYPFKDSRGAEVVAKLFDEDLHILPDALRNPLAAPWIPNPPLFVDWVKPEKYYNIVRIHR